VVDIIIERKRNYFTRYNINMNKDFIKTLSDKELEELAFFIWVELKEREFDRMEIEGRLD